MQPRPRIVRLRLKNEQGGVAIGPGKAELLQLIHSTGSISAAARQMQMSYRRAWGLVQEMNASFVESLVDSNTGGAEGGGAQLTPCGQRVLKAYLDAEAAAYHAAQPHLSKLRSRLRKPD